MDSDRTLTVAVGHKSAQVVVTEDGGLELWLDGCLRKRREPSLREPLYVWTNVELHWEEHRYVEARYWQGERRLEVTVNGLPVAPTAKTRSRGRMIGAATPEGKEVN